MRRTSRPQLQPQPQWPGPPRIPGCASHPPPPYAEQEACYCALRRSAEPALPHQQTLAEPSSEAAKFPHRIDAGDPPEPERQGAAAAASAAAAAAASSAAASSAEPACTAAGAACTAGNSSVQTGEQSQTGGR